MRSGGFRLYNHQTLAIPNGCMKLCKHIVVVQHLLPRIRMIRNSLTRDGPKTKFRRHQKKSTVVAGFPHDKQRLLKSKLRRSPVSPRIY